ncbi:MAG: histidine--tRNA ligase [Opitutales bacterium]
MFQRLKGFRDFYPDACRQRNWLFARWREAAARFNFQEFDAPILEPLELFTAKSGEEIVAQLFNFEDKGGRAVSLRPELTPSLARMVGERANALRRPVKWFNIGEHFRYEKQQKGRLRAFYQFNADLLGDATPVADAEVMALLDACLRGAGLTPEDYRIRLSDRQLWWLYLQSLGLGEASCTAVLGIVDRREREAPEAQRAQLVALLQPGEPSPESLLEAIDTFAATPDLGTLESRFANSDPGRERVAEWRRLWSMLEALGLGDRVQLDLSIVRGLAYYTGFVFEAFQTTGTGRAIAGGGRYDHLVEKLGGPPLSAVGFGLGDVVIRDLLEELGRLPELAPRLDAYLIPVNAEAEADIRRLATELRRRGYSTEYPLKVGGVGKQFKAASQAGARFAVLIGPDERASGLLKVKALATGEEATMPREGLLEALQRQTG